MRNLLKSVVTLTLRGAALLFVGVAIAAAVLSALLQLNYAGAVGITVAGVVLGRVLLALNMDRME